jgi:hypothetical protein
MHVLIAQEICCDASNNLITNGTFDPSCTWNSNPFLQGCVPGWTAEDGTPSLPNSTTNPYVWMWSHSNNGEAIATSMNFQQGVTYNVCFRIRTEDNGTGDPNVLNNATVNLIATNNPGNITGNPNGQIILQNPIGTYLNTWTSISMQFTPNANYSNLWIFPYMEDLSDGTSQAEMEIDDIVISRVKTTPIFTMKDTYCDDEPIFPITAQSSGQPYKWLIHEVGIGENIVKYDSGWLTGTVSAVDFTTLWSGFEAGKEYTITLQYRDDCGRQFKIKHQFIIKERQRFTSCIDLSCGETFDPNTIRFPGLCEGDIVDIEDLVNQVYYEPSTHISFEENTVLRLYYECCEILVCVNVAKGEETQIKEICPTQEGFLMEACGGTNGFYYYIVNGFGESSTEPTKWVEYVPGGEYSVTFISDTGCTCKVIYKFICDEIIPTDTKDSATKQSSNFTIYPNPSNGNYSIKPNFSATTGKSTYEISITNIAGKSILSKKSIPLGTTYHLNISEYTAGIYFLNITSGNTKEVKKLIKN